MTTGLDKLIEAGASVDILKKELEIKEQEIKVATEKADEVMFLFKLISFSFILDINHLYVHNTLLCN